MALVKRLKGHRPGIVGRLCHREERRKKRKKEKKPPAKELRQPFSKNQTPEVVDAMSSICFLELVGKMMEKTWAFPQPFAPVFGRKGKKRK